MTVTRLELEHLALGTLDDARRAELEAAAAGDPELAQRVAAVKASVAAASDLPVLNLPPDTAPWWSRLLRPAPLGVAVMVAALALLAVRPDVIDMRSRGGGLELSVHQVRLGEAVLQGAVIYGKEGDHLQYELVSPISGHVAVFDLQDDGTLSPFMESRAVDAGEVVTAGVVLDDYAGSERIYFLVDPEPLTHARVSGAVQRAWDEPLAELDTLPGAASHQRSVLVLRGEAL